MRLRSLLRSLLLILAVPLSIAVVRADEEETATLVDAPTVASTKALVEAGRYSDGENAARSLLKRLEEVGGEDSLRSAEALDLLVDALLQGGKSAQPETRPLAERVVALRERLLGPDHPELATSLMNLAWVLEDLGEFAQARPLHERVLAIEERAVGPAHKDIAQALMNLGLLSRAEGDYETARNYCQRALEMREELLGPEDRGVGVTLNALAVIARDMGDHDAAQALWERAVKIVEACDGPKHPATASILHNIGVELVARGEYAAAQRLHLRALAIREEVLGPDHPDVAKSLSGLAEVVTYRGDYSEAKRLLERSIDIYAKAQASESVEASHATYGLGDLLSLMGDMQGARALFERALAFREAALGPEHPSVALAQYALGRVLFASGDEPRAESLLERALANQEQTLGPDHQRVADTLLELGAIAARRKDSARARALFERSLAISERQLGPTHQGLAPSLRQLALLSERAGSPLEAKALMERAVLISTRGLGAEHPFTAEAEAELAGLLARSGETEAALEMALETERASRGHFRLTIRSLGERQALLYAKARASGVDLAVSLLVESGESPAERRRAVFDAVIGSRALVLDEIAARTRMATTSDDPEVRRLFEALSKSRDRLARVVVRGPQASPIDRYRSLLDEARREKEQAEEAITTRSLSYREEHSRIVAGLDDVRKSLPSDAALVAFVRYERRPQADPSAVGAENAGAAYAAFVSRADRDPELVPLGTAEQVDNAVACWRRELLWEAKAPGLAPRRSLERYTRAGKALRRQVWDPLAPLVAGLRTVFVVPDGSLHLANLAALPLDDGRFLIEAGPLLHVLSTERDLVGTSQGPGGNGLLLMGAPDFMGSHSRAAAHTFRGTTSACEGFRSLHFSPLPAALPELKAIGALWTGRPGSGTDPSSMLILQGGEADEAAFKKKAPGRRLIHLATHGFALGPKCGLAGGNPLTSAGLALAGANRRQMAGPDVEDGVLTAEEISSIDLTGVEWAVLSACETGMGSITAGEGVFGLRRAFQVAGARSVIMSLWPVDDAATKVWMERLYSRRLQDRLGTAEAVRQATLDVLLSRRQRGQSAHPLYWAGFVAAGDWR